MVGALQQLQTLNPGFNPKNALSASMDVGLQGYDDPKGEQFYRQLVARVEALPGVKSAAMTTFIPLSLNYSSNSVYIEGQAAERGANVPLAMIAQVGPRYFETMETPILRVESLLNWTRKMASERQSLMRHSFANSCPD